MLRSLRRRLQEAVIPNSLVLEDGQQGEGASPPPPPAIVSRLSLLHPCDLILISTPGTFYSFFRFISGHSKQESREDSFGFDHLGILLSPTHFLHIGPPNIRVLPVSVLLVPQRRPLVLRPRLTEVDRKSLLYELQRIVGMPYDIWGVYRFIAKLSLSKASKAAKDTKRSLSNLKVPKGTANNSLLIKQSIAAYSSFICTDAILSRLVAASSDFRAVLSELQQRGGAALDLFTMDSWSINDVVRLHQHYPDLLQQVDLPPYTHDEDQSITEWVERKRRMTKETARDREMDEKKKWKTAVKDIQGAAVETAKQSITSLLPSPSSLAKSVKSFSPRIASALLTLLFLRHIVKSIDLKRILIAILLVAAAEEQKRRGRGRTSAAEVGKKSKL